VKAIVNSGNRKLIGDIEEKVNPGDCVLVKGAYELRCDLFLIPTPQGMVTIHKNTVVPVDAEEEGVDISVKVHNIRYFEDMTDRGRKYDNMVAEFEDAMLENRAHRAGITPARNVPGKILVK
jgi:hypothetical protein